MKFWQKAFLAILVVFVLSIDVCLYVTSRYSFSLNVQQEINRDLGEYHFISNGIDEALGSFSYRRRTGSSASATDSLMSSYADYYAHQEVYFELKQANKLLFSNIPAAAKFGLAVNKPKTSSDSLEILSRGGRNYLYIVGTINEADGDYSFTYVRNLSELYASHAKLTHDLILVSSLVEMLLALALLLILRKLTHPIRLLQRATRKIAGGVYDERVRIPGRDEFHDLAENFNLMATSIQGKIDELDKNVEEKQRLVDNLAHELRTPLTSIHGYAEYLQGAHTNEQNRITAAGYIMSEADRMKDLVDKILDAALLRNRQLAFQEIQPLELLSQVQTLVAGKLGEKNIKLDVRCTLADSLMGDSTLLQSLLINLIDNAVKASANGSVITLSAYFDTVAILEVSDNGCGIEEEQLSLICEPFYRVDKARSRSAGGVGLGLSMCREIAELHQAEMKISSKTGKGTTVRVVFTTSLQRRDDSETPAKL